MGEYHLSKSRYCNGVQCPKILWLQKYKKEEFNSGVLNEAILSNGNKVGDLAMGLFGDFTEVPFNSDDLSSMITETKRLIDEGVENICEASFSYDNCFCSADILKNFGNNEVELYEVKSSSQVHEQYKTDVAYQYWVLTKLGYNVRKACLVYINTEYVRKGELDIKQLFNIEDLTANSKENFETVGKKVKFIKEYLKQEDEPIMEIGEHCSNPYECGFWDYCTRDMPHPEEPTVFDISRIGGKALDLYKKGIVTFNDVVKNNIKLTPNQKQQVNSYINKEDYIDKEKIKDFLDTIKYPLYFLDFESYLPCIPPFDGYHPYMQTITQYSLHILEKEGGELKHKEFLAYPDENPIKSTCEHLIKDIPYGDKGSVLVYNKGFEGARMREAICMYPEMKKELQSIIDRIVDLGDPFKNKWYYNHNFNGSWSIKVVLPTLFPNNPELDYSNLEDIQNGGDAMSVYSQMADMSKEKLEETRANLLKYCCLDTFAEVKLYEKLKELIK